MAVILTSIEQTYIDDVIHQIQCCLAELVAQIADQEYIGVDCTEKKEKVLLLKAILNSLVRNRPEGPDDDLDEKCLDIPQLNDLIEKAKEVCKKCCIPSLNEQ